MKSIRTLHRKKKFILTEQNSDVVVKNLKIKQVGHFTRTSWKRLLDTPGIVLAWPKTSQMSGLDSFLLQLHTNNQLLSSTKYVG
jgi:hypothetical protein